MASTKTSQVSNSPKHADLIKPLSDHAGLLLYCGGGIRAAKMEQDTWFIEPILVNEKPVRLSPFTTPQLQDLLRKNRIPEIAFQQFGWASGSYRSSWYPILPNRSKHMLGPADLWLNISGNTGRNRTKASLQSCGEATREEIANAYNDRDEVERLTHSIGLSLRSMDINVEQIVEFYYDQLVARMHKSAFISNKFATNLDQNLYAHVHSFFSHLGAARDYLAALIAFRLGQDSTKIDSMAKLVDKLKQTDLYFDALINVLKAKGDLIESACKADRLEISGWMKAATALRNKFIHKRPYGLNFHEKMGSIETINSTLGLYKYYRPIVQDNESQKDILNLIIEHYQHSNDLFQTAAESSGYDTKILILKSEDIISSEFNRAQI